MMKRKTRFEKLSRNLLIVSSICFVFLMIYFQSMQSTYNRKEAIVRSEIKETENEIESVKMQITEMTTLDNLISLAQNAGYNYKFGYVSDNESPNENQENNANAAQPE